MQSRIDKQDWKELNAGDSSSIRCSFTHMSNQCAMMGTSSGSAGKGAKFYCSYHHDLMREESADNYHGKDKKKFDKKHFIEWLKIHLEHLTNKDQFCEPPESEDEDIHYEIVFDEKYANHCWIKVQCGRGDW